jgi:hypothetical protein
MLPLAAADDLCCAPGVIVFFWSLNDLLAARAREPSARESMLCVQSQAYWGSVLRLTLQNHSATSAAVGSALADFTRLCGARAFGPREAATSLLKAHGLSPPDDSTGLGLLAGSGAPCALFWGAPLSSSPDGQLQRWRRDLRYAMRRWTHKARQLKAAALTASLASVCGLVASVACVASAELLTGRLQATLSALLQSALSPDVSRLIASHGIFYGPFFSEEVRSWTDVRRCVVVFLVPNVLLLLQHFFLSQNVGAILASARAVLREVTKSNGVLLAQQAELLASFADHARGLGLASSENDASLKASGSGLVKLRRCIRELTLAQTRRDLLAALFRLAGYAIFSKDAASFWAVARRSHALLQSLILTHGRQIWDDAALIAKREEAALSVRIARGEARLWTYISAREADELGTRAPEALEASRALLDALSSGYALELAQTIDLSSCDQLPLRVQLLTDEWTLASERLLSARCASAVANARRASCGEWPHLAAVKVFNGAVASRALASRAAGEKSRIQENDRR